MLLAPALVLATALAVASYKDNVHAAYINEQRAKYSEALREAEGKARKEALRLEREYLELAQEHDDLYLRNLDLASDLERLRSQRSGAGNAPSGDSTGPASNSATLVELSSEDVRFLIDFAREADAAARFAMMCYDWANR